MKLKHINILIIDDSKYDRELIKRTLSTHFPNSLFILVEGLKDYTEKISWLKPDIILCDYDLRDSDGLEILILSKKTWDVPIVFVTGSNNEEEVARAIFKGANGYVLKDNLDQLHLIVEKAITEMMEDKDRAKDKIEMFNQIKLDVQKIGNHTITMSSYSKSINSINLLEKRLLNVQK